MKAIHLMAVGMVRTGLLDALAAELARLFQVSCRVRRETLDVEFALDSIRGQHHSSMILARMLPQVESEHIRLLGITECDLYVPVLTFVFGEAQLSGSCALVSLHRLKDEFYGLPANEALLKQRLVVEAVHELGHTFGLRHCSNWRCAMASTHSVERLDLKQPGYCPECSRNILASRR
ncbi:MAG: archaemetzincin [Acidobacteria bacterium]|nr:archaemetzincin [Acidobacteriota bacterium]